VVVCISACALPEATLIQGGSGGTGGDPGGSGGTGGIATGGSGGAAGGGTGGIPEIPDDGTTLSNGPGAYSACARKGPNDELWCWGDNGTYECANGTNFPAHVPEPMQVTVPGPFRYAALTGPTMCTLSPTGAVHCLGANWLGAVGNGTQVGDTPCGNLECVTVPNETIASGVEQLAGGGFWCGGSHFCARSAGTIRCWGDLGSCSGSVPIPTPTPIAGIDDAIDLRVAPGFNCVIRADETVWCWGENNSGQLGQGDIALYSTPKQVKNITGITALGLGTGHACAQASDGFYCWGGNLFGESGQGSDNSGVLLPKKVLGMPPGVVQVAASYDATCVRTNQNEVWCFGRSDFGQLGNPAALGVPCGGMGEQCVYAPTKASISDVVEMAMGTAFVLVRKANGELWSWGDDQPGSLGNGDPLQNSGAPVKVLYFP